MNRNNEKGITRQTLSVLHAVAKKCPYHYELFCKKPKDGREWCQRLQEVAMYFAFLMILTMYAEPEAWRNLVDSFSK